MTILNEYYGLHITCGLYCQTKSTDLSVGAIRRRTYIMELVRHIGKTQSQKKRYFTSTIIIMDRVSRQHLKFTRLSVRRLLVISNLYCTPKGLSSENEIHEHEWKILNTKHPRDLNQYVRKECQTHSPRLGKNTPSTSSQTFCRCSEDRTKQKNLLSERREELSYPVDTRGFRDGGTQEKTKRVRKWEKDCTKPPLTHTRTCEKLSLA